LAAPAPATMSPVTTPQAVAGADRGSTTVPVPGLRPPTLPTEGGSGAVLDDDAAGQQTGVPIPTALPAGALLLRPQRAHHACFPVASSAEPANAAALPPGDATPTADTAARSRAPPPRRRWRSPWTAGGALGTRIPSGGSGGGC